ncbi:hypothetical protein ACOMHN_055539 [Nucella lapillus]
MALLYKRIVCNKAVVPATFAVLFKVWWGNRHHSPAVAVVEGRGTRCCVAGCCGGAGCMVLCDWLLWRGGGMVLCDWLL